ncbi:MAG: DUF805 domain-containing protein [Pseudomonadota bacterium]
MEAPGQARGAKTPDGNRRGIKSKDIADPRSRSYHRAQKSTRAARQPAMGILLMTFGQAINSWLSKSFTTSGRATCSEFWWLWAFHVVAPLCLIAAAGILRARSDIAASTVGSIAQLVYVATIPATFCCTIRRLQDTGRSAWASAMYVILVPIVWLSLLVTFNLISELITVQALAEPGPLLYALPGLVFIDAIMFGFAFVTTVLPLLLIAAILAVILLVFLSRPSQPGPNEYGPNPHEVSQ